jgi:hypothetical protein
MVTVPTAALETSASEVRVLLLEEHFILTCHFTFITDDTNKPNCVQEEIKIKLS